MAKATKPHLWRATCLPRLFERVQSNSLWLCDCRARLLLSRLLGSCYSVCFLLSTVCFLRVAPLLSMPACRTCGPALRAKRRPHSYTCTAHPSFLLYVIRSTVAALPTVLPPLFPPPPPLVGFRHFVFKKQYFCSLSLARCLCVVHPPSPPLFLLVLCVCVLVRPFPPLVRKGGGWGRCMWLGGLCG